MVSLRSLLLISSTRIMQPKSQAALNSSLYGSIKSVSTTTSFNFQEYMRKKKASINRALDEAVPAREASVINEAMRYSLLAAGTKRFRPMLCIAACELVGGTEAAAMPAACALEMAHIVSIMHDDLPCIDDDDLRRGQPSNHKVFGDGVALLAGDALLAAAFNHIAVATSTELVPPEMVVRAAAELGHAFKEMTEGQVMDIRTKGVKDVTTEHLDEIFDKKSGALVEFPVTTGAIFGGADEEEVARLRKYAQLCGRMVMLIDDIMDWEEDQAAQRVTYPAIVGLEKTKEAEYRSKRAACCF